MIHIQEIITHEDDLFNIIIQKDNRSIRLNSSRPKNEAEKIFSKLPQNSPAYVIGGLGFGYLLEIILERTNALCIIYEPLSEIFYNSVNTRKTLNNLLNDPRVILTHNLESLTNIISDNKLNDLSFTIQRSYTEIFPDQFSSIKEYISSGIRKYEVGNATLLRFGKLWTKNIFRNMHRFFTSQKLIPYIGWGKDKPAVVIGAGPSLEESLPYIKNIHDKIILIACDTALPMLHNANINPDFVITVDPQEKNSFYLRYSKNKNHILIADPGVHDSSFENYSNNNIILMDSIFPLYKPFEQFWKPCGLLASGGSVSTSAFDFARIIQADPIIMVGQDLSFTKRKVHNQGNILTEFKRTTYNRLNPYHKNQAFTTYTSHSQKIKGRYTNSTVYADARFILFRDWFSTEIPKTHANVIVAGMEGAYLEGAHHCTVAEAFSNITQTISKVHLKQHNINNINKLHLYLEHILNSTNKIIPTCKQILISLQKAQLKQNLDVAIKETNRLQQILSSPEYKDISHLIAISIQQSIQQAMNFNSPSSQEHLTILFKICQDTLEGIQILNKYIKKVLCNRSFT